MHTGVYYYGHYKHKEKGKHLNTLERYHTYKISKGILHMNDTYIDTDNSIFETLQELNTRQQHTYPICPIWEPTP
jgi:hypothetical protein